MGRSAKNGARKNKLNAWKRLRKVLSLMEATYNRQMKTMVSREVEVTIRISADAFNLGFIALRDRPNNERWRHKIIVYWNLVIFYKVISVALSEAVTLKITQRFVALWDRRKGDHYNVDTASVIFQYRINLQSPALNLKKIIWQNDGRLTTIPLISLVFNDRFPQTQHRGYLERHRNRNEY